MNTTRLQTSLPYIVFALTMAFFGYNMLPQSGNAGDFDFRGYGRIPVIEKGRFKPMDTFARSNLMIITHRQTYYDYDAGIRYPATKWLLDAQTTPPPSMDDDLEELFPKGKEERPAWIEKVFRIENDQLLRFLNLKPREGLRYSFKEIAKDETQFRAFLDEIQRLQKIPPKDYTLFDAKIVELYDHLQRVVQLSAHQEPRLVPDPAGSDQWKSFRAAVEEFGTDQNLPDRIDAKCYAYYRALLVSYDQNDKAGFNRTVAEYLAYMKAQGKMGHSDIEVFFNEFAPFWNCMLVYIVTALAGGVSWLLLAFSSPWSPPIRKAAFAAMIVAFGVHLSGLILRMYLQDRPFVFVTTLYSSAVFIGLASVFVCLIVEGIYRNGIALVVGSVTGFCTLIIAHILSFDGDTMVALEAVLDTNFWLATHVTCVTLGYTMAFVAGVMGIAYIFLGIFTDTLRKGVSADLTRMTYGVLCAGMFLSFVGTVLGGLWADYSWGRFWGWDPKENGALLIVIWIALILHARWGGMVKQRGIAVLSVMGIIITSWSWFGTNFLGVGLHAYGGAKADSMLALILIDLCFLAIALLGAWMPLEMWRSFRPLDKPMSPMKPPIAVRPTAT